MLKIKHIRRRNMATISQITQKSKQGSEMTAIETRQLANMAAKLQQLVSQFKIS